MQGDVLVNESQKLALSARVWRFHSGPSSKASMVNMNRTISKILIRLGPLRPFP
jgi:hypothetical protein